MGTRNLICVVSENEFKVSQYCQWDGYPTGQGQGIVDFLLNKMKYETLKSNIDKCEFLSEDEIKEINNDESWRDEKPWLSRDCGSDILQWIQHEPKKLLDSIGFINDGLFCEYAYVVDLDNKALEVYEGFNKKPIPSDQRFFSENKDESGYYPAIMVAKYKFDELTIDTMEELGNKLAIEDDE